MAYCHSDLGVWYVNVSYMWNELQRWRDFRFLCLRFNLWWLRSVFLIGCQDWVIAKKLFSLSPVRCSLLCSICAHHWDFKQGFLLPPFWFAYDLCHVRTIFQITWQDSILTCFMLKVTEILWGSFSWNWHYDFFFLGVKALQMLPPNSYVICLQGSQWQHLIATAVFQLGDDSGCLYFFSNVQFPSKSIVAARPSFSGSLNTFGLNGCEPNYTQLSSGKLNLNTVSSNFPFNMWLKIHPWAASHPTQWIIVCAWTRM